MACDSTIFRPIDAFIKYFGDIKPYHTKILEIVEQYSFKEEMIVNFLETDDISITLSNEQLCKGVGFGLDFDDDCGFDALDCCDLFQCIGGFGLIFDNSDLLVSTPIRDIIGGTEGSDASNTSRIVIPGVHLQDTFLNIKSIPDLQTIVIEGDQSAYFNAHHMFWVVQKNSYKILTASGSQLTISGNHAAQLLAKLNIEIQNSGANDGVYGVVSANYSAGITTIIVNRPLEAVNFGNIIVNANNKNNGPYQILGFSIVGGDTHLQLSPSTQARFIDSEVDNVHGSVQLRTGFIPNRRLWIEDDVVESNNGEWKIAQVWYDVSDASTVVVVDGTLVDSLNTPASINLYGYETAAGFDNVEECSEPKPWNVHASISERLVITIEETPQPSPTPSPTPETSATPTPTPTATPESTATPTPTPTPTVTESVTPTPTPSVTPSPSPEVIDEGVWVVVEVIP